MATYGSMFAKLIVLEIGIYVTECSFVHNFDAPNGFLETLNTTKLKFPITILYEKVLQLPRE